MEFWVLGGPEYKKSMSEEEVLTHGAWAAHVDGAGVVMGSGGAEVVLEVVEIMNESPSLNSLFGGRCEVTTSEW